MADDWSIIYQRPDGWWSAGAGFKTEGDAKSAAEAHEWGGSRWQVVETAEVQSMLCEEALE